MPAPTSVLVDVLGLPSACARIFHFLGLAWPILALCMMTARVQADWPRCMAPCPNPECGGFCLAGVLEDADGRPKPHRTPHMCFHCGARWASSARPPSAGEEGVTLTGGLQVPAAARPAAPEVDLEPAVDTGGLVSPAATCLVALVDESLQRLRLLASPRHVPPCAADLPNDVDPEICAGGLAVPAAACLAAPVDEPLQQQQLQASPLHASSFAADLPGEAEPPDRGFGVHAAEPVRK